MEVPTWVSIDLDGPSRLTLLPGFLDRAHVDSACGADHAAGGYGGSAEGRSEADVAATAEVSVNTVSLPPAPWAFPSTPIS